MNIFGNNFIHVYAESGFIQYFLFISIINNSAVQPDVEIGSITKKIASQQYTGLD